MVLLSSLLLFQVVLLSRSSSFGVLLYFFLLLGGTAVSPLSSFSGEVLFAEHQSRSKHFAFPLILPKHKKPSSKLNIDEKSFVIFNVFRVRQFFFPFYYKFQTEFAT